MNQHRRTRITRAEAAAMRANMDALARLDAARLLDERERDEPSTEVQCDFFGARAEKSAVRMSAR